MNLLTILEALPVRMVEFLRKKTVPKEARSESLWEFSHSPNAYNEGFPNCVDVSIKFFIKNIFGYFESTKVAAPNLKTV